MSTAATNWKTLEDGTLLASQCKFYPSTEGTYEIEFSNSSAPIGLILETNHEGNYAIVKRIAADADAIVKRAVSVGDVLVGVNNHIMLEEEFGDIITFLDVLRESHLPRKIKFLNPKKCPVSIYAQRMELQQKFNKDMFGFLRSVEYLQRERQHKASRIQIDAQRDIDWVEYLKRIGGPDNIKPTGMLRPSKELKELVRRGIPVAYRPLVWPRLCLANRYRLRYPPNYYHELLKRTGDLDPRVETDIVKDIDRTFPEHDYFSSGGGCEALRRVLVAHALHNPSIGYCQSLNFVAGLMLLFMNEEDAFWLFITVVDTLLPHDYYTASMVGTYIDQFVLSHIIKTRLPEIHSTLESASLQLPLVTVQWFMCVYINALPPETAMRCWDIFLNEGSKVLFRVAVGLFKLYEKQLLATKDPGEIYTVLKGMGKNVIDADKLIAAAYRSYVPPVKMNSLVYASSKQQGIALSTPRPSNASSLFTLQKQKSTVARRPPPSRSSSGGSSSQQTDALRRQSSWFASQVPDLLVGIGLAHIGPKADSTPPASDTLSQDNDSYVVHPETSSLNPSGTFPTSVAPTLHAVDTFANVDILQARDHVLRGINMATSFVTQYVNPKKLNKDSNSSYKHVRDYRTFSRTDIEKWRAEFRPEVEERFQMMERARMRWRERESTKEIPSAGTTQQFAAEKGEETIATEKEGDDLGDGPSFYSVDEDDGNKDVWPDDSSVHHEEPAGESAPELWNYLVEQSRQPSDALDDIVGGMPIQSVSLRSNDSEHHHRQLRRLRDNALTKALENVEGIENIGSIWKPLFSEALDVEYPA